ncbi:ornithine cyclodeaminase family protein [Metabacillus sp. Hm71]|uniref:ornithine cyclodeaminase family protein n=1 Tax=Metabacillus sp. Hm71 TaxID=3450743 RepID=UPI003F423C5A
MIILNDKDINNLITISDVIETIESYYLSDGEKREFVPERLFINDKDTTALLMPSFYQEYYVAKLVGIAPGNAKIKEPTLRGVLILFNRNTMEPLGVFDARTITALRTGAVSGLGMKYLSNKLAQKVGVIGTGDQGWSHLKAACAVRQIEEVLVNNRSFDRMEEFITTAKKHFPNIKIKASTVEELVEEAEIIITTTTSKDPVIPENLNVDMAGKHFAASGSFKPFMQELPDSIIKKADRIFVDTYDAFLESKDMIKAKEFGKDETKVLSLNELSNIGSKAYKEGQLTIFKSVGNAIFDILTAKLIYEKHQKVK